MHEVQCIIFDLDNTLINYGGVTPKAWQLTVNQLIQQYGLSVDPSLLAKTIIAINDALWEDESRRPRGNFSFDEVRRSIVREALRKFDLDRAELVLFLVQHYGENKHAAVEVFPDVPKTLKILGERGYQLALLTNGDGVFQREKLSRFHLEPYFDGIFIDGEQGVGKPERAAYEGVLHYFHCLPSQACMVGDHYLWEVVAPKQYGLHAVWVNRGELGRKGHEDILPDATITQISECLDLFKKAS